MQLEHSSIVVLFAGLGFLLFGLSLASESLQKLAANHIRRILNRLQDSGVMGVAIGALLTLLMQSAGAVTATLVNLGTAGVLTLPQVMGVIIGTSVGAALTVQLISLHVAGFGLPMFVLGFGVSFIVKNRRVRTVFEFIMAVGLLFFGLELIRGGSLALVKIDFLADAFAILKSNWLAGLIVSGALTSFFHSSTATLGVVMGLSASGVLSSHEAMVWIYGANIGTTSTALFTGLRANYLGRQIAWANFLYRVAAVAVFLPFSSVVLDYLTEVVVSAQAQVASAYLVLNLFAASLFFPLRKIGVLVIQKMIVPREGEQEFSVRFLKRSTYESFAMGLAHAKREMFEMGDIVYKMVEKSIQIFQDEDPEHFVQIRKLDDRVDLLLREIKFFLIRVSDHAPEGLNQSAIDVISFGSDLEAAADIIDHHLLDLASKKAKKRLEFSSESWKDLLRLHQAAIRATSLSITFFQTEDPKIAEELIQLKYEARDIEQVSRESHITRLSQGESLGASAIYLETLNTYLQLIEMLNRHAQRARNQSKMAVANQY